MISGLDSFTYLMFSYNDLYPIEIVSKQRKARNIQKFISPKPDIANTEKGTRLSPVLLKIDEEKKKSLYKMPKKLKSKIVFKC